MIQGCSPVVQAFLGTLLTWGLTALGSACVFLLTGSSGGSQRKILASSLGFASGVMLAASYWSLLAPSIELAKDSEFWNSNAFLMLTPVAGGFLLGALFVYLADLVLDSMGVESPAVVLAVTAEKYNSNPFKVNSFGHDATYDGLESGENNYHTTTDNRKAKSQWKRILLLIVAITVHNIPEGLAVGVGFGAIGSTTVATFESARSLAIGIGLQNFPEGLAVSLPLVASGFSPMKGFWYGQLSGMVEPIAGVLGAVAVSIFQPILPWALSFAAGAMIYVVISDIVPESHQGGHEKLANWWSMCGFVVMMSLDVGLS